MPSSLHTSDVLPLQRPVPGKHSTQPFPGTQVLLPQSSLAEKPPAPSQIFFVFPSQLIVSFSQKVVTLVLPGATHLPAWHSSPERHALPQAPQLRRWVCRLKQWLSQLVSLRRQLAVNAGASLSAASEAFGSGAGAAGVQAASKTAAQASVLKVAGE